MIRHYSFSRTKFGCVNCGKNLGEHHVRNKGGKAFCDDDCAGQYAESEELRKSKVRERSLNWICKT
jgi:hypothetical protein